MHSAMSWTLSCIHKNNRSMQAATEMFGVSIYCVSSEQCVQSLVVNEVGILPSIVSCLSLVNKQIL